jgi:hypothetical protein
MLVVVVVLPLLFVVLEEHRALVEQAVEPLVLEDRQALEQLILVAAVVVLSDLVASTILVVLEDQVLLFSLFQQFPILARQLVRQQ